MICVCEVHCSLFIRLWTTKLDAIYLLRFRVTPVVNLSLKMRVCTAVNELNIFNANE